MGDLKPLGSEKLSGDDKLKRILELTYYNNNKNTSATQKAEHISESATGVYGIVREKDGYYVKRGLNESSLDYIGGMFMKNKNKFSSYAEALKRLELLKGQEMLQEQTKYVLKSNKPSAAPTEMPPPPAEAAAEMPPALPPADGEMPAAPEMGDEMGGEMPAAPEMGDEMGDEMGGDQETAPEDGEDKMKVVQKLTGKLGQKIRDIQDDLESDDIKYIINSVLSAVNLDKLDLEDKEEILGKFEDEEEFAGEDGTEGGDEMPSEVPVEEPEAELGEVDGIDALENLVNMSFDEGFDDFDTQVQSDELSFDDEISWDEEGEDENMDSPVGRHDALDNVDVEKEKVRTKTKHFVEPDSEEDLYYRQASMDSMGDFDSDADIFGDDGYGDTFNFDLKEEDPLGDEFGNEMGDTTSDVNDPDFYDGDEVKPKEIDINELTDIINNSVKETLRKHFE